MITDRLHPLDAFSTFRVAMYGALVTIVITNDCVAASKAMNLKWCADHSNVNADTRGIGAWTVLFDREQMNHDTIAHEIFHLALEIGNWRGLNHQFDKNESNNEAYAYLIGWLSERIHRAIKNMGERITPDKFWSDGKSSVDAEPYRAAKRSKRGRH